MGNVFIDFIGNHILGVSIFLIILALIWRFGIQPRLGLTDSEVQKKITDTMDKVEENLQSNIEVNQGDIIDNSSMPFSK